MIFLIEEALRIADEGDSPMLGAKLSDCIDCAQAALAEMNGEARTTPLLPTVDGAHRAGPTTPSM